MLEAYRVHVADFKRTNLQLPNLESEQNLFDFDSEQCRHEQEQSKQCEDSLFQFGLAPIVNEQTSAELPQYIAGLQTHLGTELFPLTTHKLAIESHHDHIN
jgi:hypothetical protein